MSLFSRDVLTEIERELRSTVVFSNIPGFHIFNRKKIKKFHMGDIERIYQAHEPYLDNLCIFIGEGYVEKMFKAAFAEDGMDYLGIYSEKGDLLAFIIAIRGECRVLPEVWSVALVCSAGLPGSGQIILAAKAGKKQEQAMSIF